ncbi:hypothetical protein MKX03_021551 [Papaver bracteatum]|nr:hypothetical protein MKX03_021551 [Papaver bracteatum]
MGSSSSSSAAPVLPLDIKIMIACQSILTDISRRSNDTINRNFLNLFNYFVKVDIVVDPNKNLFLRLFTPTDKISSDRTLPVIIYFHGGGFSFCSPDFFLYDNFCRRLAKNIPAVVVSANYRLSPEYRFPTQYEDGLQSLRFLDSKLSHGFPANADLSRCFLAGDSAGGQLGSPCCELKVIGLISIQPFFGGEERTESELRLTNVPIVSVEKTDWHWKAFLPEGCDRDHEAVNVFGPNSVDISGLSKFPVTLVVIGGFDPLQDWQRRYFEGLKKIGKEVYLVEYPKAIHIFYGFPELIESSLLITDVKKFIEKRTNLLA